MIGASILRYKQSTHVCKFNVISTTSVQHATLDLKPEHTTPPTHHTHTQLTVSSVGTSEYIRNVQSILAKLKAFLGNSNNVQNVIPRYSLDLLGMYSCMYYVLEYLLRNLNGRCAMENKNRMFDFTLIHMYSRYVEYVQYHDHPL